MEIKLSNKILVVGDCMLDRYWVGKVVRISPEAPVPILNVTSSYDRLGGAANVAKNLASVGAEVDLLSVVGNDDNGNTINRLVEQSGITSFLRFDPTISTTLKLRTVAQTQQLLRIDFESSPSKEILASLTGKFKEIINNYEVVIFSDYGKGGLSHISEMITFARQIGITVLVDPKGSDYAKYKGASVITPNREELARVIGPWNSEKELIQKTTKLRKSLELEAILLTRSEEGMTLFTKDEVKSIPSKALEVYDVSGAGDTVIAILAYMLAKGMKLLDAAKVANAAAGIVVSKLGTASVNQKELRSIENYEN